jgi:EAL domain-containing protein (putative c-di-GMP-specific phosphodiesterase class I)/ActR/RegA family two-component response regulator
VTGFGSTLPGRLLIVDDDPTVASTLARILAREGHSVVTLSSGEEAVARATGERFDVILSDVSMPGMSGIEMLRKLRELGQEVPVIFVTGTPRLEDAVRAVEHGAFRYLTKPVEREALASVVSEALQWRRLTRAAGSGPTARDREALESALRRASTGFRMAYQPIVAVEGGAAFGYEALLRSSEPALPTPLAVLDAAEKLGALHSLGRHLRAMVASQADVGPYEHAFFVNVHPADLADTDLYDPEAPLSRHARSVVLELTERASIEGIGDVDKRFAALRTMGYRIAVDDLGAGYAGLSYFARVRPDIVKIDMSLVRDVDRDRVKRRVVASVCELARTLDVVVVAEGIETEAELECIATLGAQLAQGYAIAYPGPPYPSVSPRPAR